MEHGFLSVPSGVKVPFRVLRPEDAPALQRVHARCSERTIYLHFFGSMEELSEAQARISLVSTVWTTSVWSRFSENPLHRKPSFREDLF
jgi:hypothetical protein